MEHISKKLFLNSRKIIKKKDKEKKEKMLRLRVKKNIKYNLLKVNILILFHLMRKKKFFIYSPELARGNRYLDNYFDVPIEQNIVPLYTKLDIFI